MENLTLTVSKEDMELLRQYADLSGQSVPEFALEDIYERIEDT
ncbi:MAG: DUF6290 family protein [Microbacteriaceae bacterium]|nr:DUF6290 family protein [Microbacteriaceae bacterium]